MKPEKFATLEPCEGEFRMFLDWEFDTLRYRNTAFILTVIMEYNQYVEKTDLPEVHGRRELLADMQETIDTKDIEKIPEFLLLCKKITSAKFS